jgi:hypothetical protein
VTETQGTPQTLGAQSGLYLDVADAYRTARNAGLNKRECRSAAVRTVRRTLPSLSEPEAQRLAERIIGQFQELYPGWLSNHTHKDGA